jgi:plastocyanin
MSRRRFISVVGAVLSGASLLGLSQACGATGMDTTTPSPLKGAVRGTVVDMNGSPQGIGRVYLLQKSGLNVGVYANVDASGRFDFGDVDVGSYLLRYWASNQASVPEPLPNPVRIAVTTDAPVVVQFRVVLGQSPAAANEREIYIGDFFFQEQPVGPSNGTVTAKVGTVLCWYNVGRVLHNVAGGPWGDSGPIALDGNFMWKSDRVGTFPYRCTYHGTEMLATLEIVP